MPSVKLPKALPDLGSAFHGVRVLQEAGLLDPKQTVNLLMLGRRWGFTVATAYMAAARTAGDRTAVIDELGSLTFKQVHERTNRLASALRNAGVGPRDNVAIMCRDHRGIVEASVALAKLGANALYLNTGFAGPQMKEVVEREEARALIYDQEFEKLLGDADIDRRFIAWVEDDTTRSGPSLEELIEKGDPDNLPAPEKEGRVVILTSGTTGTPKGAPRASAGGVATIVPLLEKIPFRTKQTTVIAAPMFHSWGMAHFTIAAAFRSTIVIRRKFDPEATLKMVADNKATALAVVPVMLQRVLELPKDTIKKYDTSSLRVIAASGSALTGDLATRVMDTFGDVLYNLYGSTEVAWATIAKPEDMRAAPDTAGKAPQGTIVRIFDDKGKEVPIGETGRIFVGNEMLFEGYTGGGHKEVIDGLMSSGDVGHLDAEGRLFVEGRDDEMIVSGGENVFPAEVEDLLGKHEAVAEVAVVGVKDEQFGQRLKAFVVLRKGATLSEDDVKAHVKDHLARYKIPRDVEFLDELPRNATGKILKRELKDKE